MKNDEIKLFEEIYAGYYSYIFDHIYYKCGSKELAEDITQETFFSFWRRIGAFRGECSVKTWLLRIANNKLIDHLRKTGTATIELTDDIAAPVNEIDNIIEQYSVKHFQECILRLPTVYREVLLLYLDRDVPLKEISGMYGKSQSWAKVIFFRTKKMLQEMMNDENR